MNQLPRSASRHPESRRPYGVGLAYRSCLQDDIFEHADEIDLLEIPTEDYIVRSRLLRVDPDGSLLRAALERFPAVAHGISLSLGSVEPPDEGIVRRTGRFLEEYGIDHMSEHLAYHRIDGTDVSLFLCLPFEEAAARWVAAKYGVVRRALGRPLALENVSYYYSVPGCGLAEAEFLRAGVTELTDCTLLLDVTNIFNNATNHGYDPVEFIRRLPGGRVRQLHLAGGHRFNGRWEDSHSQPVMAPVWDLLDEVLRHTAADMVILERDSNFHPFENVLPDLRKAREIFLRHRPAKEKDEGGRRKDEPKGPGSSFLLPPSSFRPEPPAPAACDFEDCTHVLTDPVVQQLRAFQSATVAVLTDPEMGALWVRDPAQTAARFGLNETWSKRLLACDRARLEQIQQKWQRISANREKARREHENAEWAAWARAAGAVSRQGS